MGAIIAGAAIAAVGAGVSAYGASQNASATKDAAQFSAYLEGKFAKRQEGLLSDLIDSKEQKLQGINSILDRYDGGAAFGDSDVLANIRKAQSDFAALAAGDFNAFQDQLDSILSATLANTYGSGAAEGTFTQLAADTIMGLRERGTTNALGIGASISQESFNLLGVEFGIMDKEFDTQYMIGRNRLSAQTGAAMTAASQAGVGTAATGQALTQIGGLVTNVGGYFGNQDFIREMKTMAGGVTTTGANLSTRPAVSLPTYPSFSAPSVPRTSGGTGGGYFGFQEPALPTGGDDAFSYAASLTGADGGYGVLPPLQ
jgi:hypothetical protein